MELNKLWNDFLNKQNSQAREQIIIHYLPLVRSIAGRLAVKAPHFMQQDDLENYGVIGLMEAVDKYNPQLGVDFEGFAYHRVRGAILDEIRRASWVPRITWQRQQAVKKAREKLEQAGVPVTQQALAEAAGLAVEELHRLNTQANANHVYSLEEEITGGEGERVRRTDFLEDRNSPDPLAVIDEIEDKRILTEAIASLNERDQLLLALYYQEELTMKEIGAVLEVSESRVCQLHKQALKKLRKAVELLN